MGLLQNYSLKSMIAITFCGLNNIQHYLVFVKHVAAQVLYGRVRMDIKEGYLAGYYLEMNIAVLAVERIESQVKLAGVHCAVLPTDG